MDGGDPAAGDIRVGCGRRSPAQAGVGYGHGLGGAIIPATVGCVGPQDAAGSIFIMFFRQDVILNPGYVQYVGNRCYLAGIGANSQETAIPSQDGGPAPGNGRRHQAGVAPPLSPHLVQVRPFQVQTGA